MATLHPFTLEFPDVCAIFASSLPEQLKVVGYIVPFVNKLRLSCFQNDTYVILKVYAAVLGKMVQVAEFRLDGDIDRIEFAEKFCEQIKEFTSLLCARATKIAAKTQFPTFDEDAWRIRLAFDKFKINGESYIMTILLDK